MVLSLHFALALLMQGQVDSQAAFTTCESGGIPKTAFIVGVRPDPSCGVKSKGGGKVRYYNMLTMEPVGKPEMLICDYSRVNNTTGTGYYVTKYEPYMRCSPKFTKGRTVTKWYNKVRVRKLSDDIEYICQSNPTLYRNSPIPADYVVTKVASHPDCGPKILKGRTVTSWHQRMTLRRNNSPD